MVPEDTIRIAGKVLEALPGPIFRVQLSNGFVLMAHLPRRQRARADELTPGWEVDLEISPYDLSRGRIVLPPVAPARPDP